MLADTQARHVVPRLAGVRVESAQLAPEGMRGQSGPGGPKEAREARAEAAAEAERSRREQEETERMARLLAESVVNIRLTFHVDSDTGEVTIKVIDNVTGEVVRYIPPEELAMMMNHLREFAGLVVDRKR